MERWRTVIRKRPWLNIVYKTLITIIGVAVVIIGVILIPLPGPGWLIVFIGMTILGSEYHWARRFTSWLRMMLARFWYWWRAWRRRRRTRKVAKQRAKRIAREGL
ncbi:TIGR02611 family protein [Leucobacter tardus]|uniref:TIGR02611 family protein n=2 Tax=Leucobacter tardus TaxID=501483 RepID=A0A939QJK0_9MICO|nr:TIGR02611 family protein [Leucobacter tardus]